MQYDLLTDEGFEQYVDSIDERLLASSEGRRALSYLDPLAMSLIYFPHHLRGPQTGDRITFADPHVFFIEYGKTWIVKPTKPRQQRDIIIAPRESSKSTWTFVLLPLWSAAHLHDDFIAAFSDSGPQAQMHLASFKLELDTNELLRYDFPELCTPAKRDRGVTRGDTQKLYRAASGFTFAAGGVDTGVLGMKDGNRRPSRLLLDDVEPGEAQYSAYQCQQRLITVCDSILPLNEFAPVTWVGTVTRSDSMVHQAVKSLNPNEQPAPWIKEQNFKVHHFQPIVRDEATGEERSIWPAKWSMEYLESIRHTRAFKKNFANDPMGMDGDFWRDDDFTYQWLEGCSSTILSIDPFVKKKKTSDPCGLAVISYLPKRKVSDTVWTEPKCMVEFADDCTKTGRELREVVVGLLQQFPYIGEVLIEDNQGGDLWTEVLHDLPVPVTTMGNTVNKDVRTGQLHAFYQARRVVHAHQFPKAEAQMVSYPGIHDDIIDAIGNGVFKYIKPIEKKSGMVF